MTIGCLMLDLENTFLGREDIEMLQHPLCGGIILFTRNFESQQQINQLCSDIRKAAGKSILIAVDHEGGRVQRFHEKFSKIPAMGNFKKLQQNEHITLSQIEDIGWLMAAEVIASGIDISFAPVIDIDSGLSRVIGDRGFSDDPLQVVKYASAFIQGMNNAGMLATGKHFPGHGSTEADSHYHLPIDPRSFSEIENLDLSIFKNLCDSKLQAVIPAHVVYSEIDEMPACFSKYWLQTILRDELGFDGTIFSDDLSMAGAKVIGTMVERADIALNAGCDMVLCCNDKQATYQLLDNLPQIKAEEKTARIEKMISKNKFGDFKNLQNLEQWQRCHNTLIRVEKQL